MIPRVRGFEGRRFVGRNYAPVPNRPRRFLDRISGITIDILVTGHYPGRGGPAPFAFPDPTATSEEIEKIQAWQKSIIAEIGKAKMEFREPTTSPELEAAFAEIGEPTTTA